VGIQPLTPELAKGFNVGQEGVLVNQVMPRSPAEAAGLQIGDLILSIEGRPVKDPRQLQQIIADAEIGKTLEVIVLRDRARQTLRVQVGEMPAG